MEGELRRSRTRRGSSRPGSRDWPRHPDTGELFYCGDAGAGAAARRPRLVHPAAHRGRAGRHRAGGQRYRLLDPGRALDRRAQHRRQPSPSAASSSRASRATVPGYSVLLYTGFPPSRDLQTHPPIIQIVRTLPYDTGISIGGSAGLHRRGRPARSARRSSSRRTRSTAARTASSSSTAPTSTATAPIAPTTAPPGSVRSCR